MKLQKVSTLVHFAAQIVAAAAAGARDLTADWQQVSHAISSDAREHVPLLM